MASNVRISVGVSLRKVAKPLPRRPRSGRRTGHTRSRCHHGCRAAEPELNAWLPPGYWLTGSQMPGMGQALAEAFPAARHLFQEIDDALSQHLSRLMFEGPERDLMLTENAQPALLAVSLAAMRVLASEAGFDIAQHAAYVAG